MKERKEKMLAIPMGKLDPMVGFSAPLFVYLPLNNKFVPVRLSGDPLGGDFFDRLKAKRYSELWTWADYKAPLPAPELSSDSHVEANNSEEKNGGATSSPRELSKPASQTGTEKREHEATELPLTQVVESERPAAQEEILLADALTDKELSPKEKAKILSKVGKQFLRTVSQLRSSDVAERDECVKKSKSMVDQILLVAGGQSDIYMEILNIRQAQEEIEHSTMVGTMAAMFALSLGYVDESLLSDLVAAAVFHDVGLVEVNKPFLLKNRSEWSPEEWHEFEGHTEMSVRLLSESQMSFHPRVVRMVAEHHERYDGSGFPHGLKGSEIDETSQILALANHFDHLCSSQEGRENLPFAEAFEQVFGEHGGENAVASPEILQRIYQFAMRERAAAEELEMEAALHVKQATDAVGSRGKVQSG